MSDPTRAQQAQILEDLASAPAFFSDRNDDDAWRKAARAGAAALRAPSPVVELEVVIDRFIAEMETAIPSLLLRADHRLVQREMERAKGRTLRGLGVDADS